MLAPNKQNYLLLKKQQANTEKGLKLLKEKRNSLISIFLKLARQGKIIEQTLATESSLFMNYYLKEVAFLDQQTLLDSMTSVPSTRLTVKKKKVSGVAVEQIDLDVQAPNRNWRPAISNAFQDFSLLLPDVLELSQIKINCQRFAIEIKKVSRQIVNVEKLIETIRTDKHTIKQALAEKDNFEKATLIKLFS
jgi:V/A-type H+/Na+-transporting ATPase subunit D